MKNETTNLKEQGGVYGEVGRAEEDGKMILLSQKSNRKPQLCKISHSLEKMLTGRNEHMQDLI